MVAIALIVVATCLCVALFIIAKSSKASSDDISQDMHDSMEMHVCPMCESHNVLLRDNIDYEAVYCNKCGVEIKLRKEIDT